MCLAEARRGRILYVQRRGGTTGIDPLLADRATSTGLTKSPGQASGGAQLRITPESSNRQRQTGQSRAESRTGDLVMRALRPPVPSSRLSVQRAVRKNASSGSRAAAVAVNGKQLSLLPPPGNQHVRDIDGFPP